MSKFKNFNQNFIFSNRGLALQAILYFFISMYLVRIFSYDLTNIAFIFLAIFRSVFLVLTLIFGSVWFYKSIVKKRNKKIRFEGIILLVFTSFIFFIVGELIIMFIPRSHGFGTQTLNSKIWNIYYKQINELGYRDNEFLEPRNSENKKKIIALGDSFTWGHGVKVDERFSNILQKYLINDAIIYNLGKNGSDTIDQFSRLLQFKEKPDVLIYQYFLNDIDGAAKNNDLKYKFDNVIDKLSYIKMYSIKNSFLINYIFWSIPALYQDNENSYYNYLKEAYSNDIIMKEHLADIRKIINHCKENNVNIIVVVFPFLNDLVTSKRLLNPIVNYFDKNNIQTLYADQLVEGLDISERIVNLQDSHPSAYVHGLIAKSLYQILSINI